MRQLLDSVVYASCFISLSLESIATMAAPAATKIAYKSVQETSLRTTSPALALRQARLHLQEHGDFPLDGIDERVARSWRRSMAAGLLPNARLTETEHASAVG
jgi:hypothetical protein